MFAAKPSHKQEFYSLLQTLFLFEYNISRYFSFLKWATFPNKMKFNVLLYLSVNLLIALYTHIIILLIKGYKQI